MGLETQLKIGFALAFKVNCTSWLGRVFEKTKIEGDLVHQKAYETLHEIYLHKKDGDDR